MEESVLVSALILHTAKMLPANIEFLAQGQTLDRLQATMV